MYLSENTNFLILEFKSHFQCANNFDKIKFFKIFSNWKNVLLYIISLQILFNAVPGKKIAWGFFFLSV